MFSFNGVHCGAALISAMRSGFAFSTLALGSFSCHFLHFSLVADPLDASTLSSIQCVKKKCVPRPAQQTLTRAFCALRIRTRAVVQKASPSSGRFTEVVGCSTIFFMMTRIFPLLLVGSQYEEELYAYVGGQVARPCPSGFLNT